MPKKLSRLVSASLMLLQLNITRKALIIALVVLMGLPMQPFSGAMAIQNPTPDKFVINDFEDIKRHLSTKLLEVIEEWKVKRLQAALDVAEIQYIGGNVCGAAKTLGEYLRLAQSFGDEQRKPALEDFFNRSWALRQAVLSTQPGGKSCEGAEGFNREPEARETESDNQRLHATIKFGEPRLTTVEVDGETFTEVELPGIQTAIGEPGLPGVPVHRQLIALPRGAKPQVSVKVDGARQYRLKLYPFQPQPVDRAFRQEKGEKFPAERFQNPPFTLNKEVYAQDALYPHQVCTVTPIGKARDLSVAQLSCAAGQYNPAKGSLVLFDSLEVNVVFEGGDKVFTYRTRAKDFELSDNIYASAVLNKNAVIRHSEMVEILRFHFGEEFLILTHPDFRSAADRLAAWKNSKGIITRVVNVNDGGGAGPDTREQIDAYIENEYNRSLIRPSYVLLLGDAEFIAPFYVNTSGSSTTGTDYPYALLSADGDEVPDFAVGRIPVDTIGQADVVVDKIINYEKNPPFNFSFYSNASIASQFQCCRYGSPAGRDERSFIETSELVRNELIAQGKHVERIYTRTGYDTPRRYYNGTALPSDLAPGSGFAWDGDTTDIVNAFNAGRFLILHRDHGWEEGWGHPEFTSTNVTNDLSNGSLLPVVFSVNCASGLFDNETAGGDYGTTFGGVYFAERLLRKQNGGAVGMLGDTRNSPTWANSALTRGFFDAVWPNTLPAYGGSTSHRRLGDILNYSKCYLMTQVGVAGTTEAPSSWDVTSELYMWHVIGDPTLQMWTGFPYIVHIPTKIYLQLARNVLELRYEADDAVITAFQETRGEVIPIGRGVVKNGEAALSLVSIPSPGAEIKLVASLENGLTIPLKISDRD